MKILWTTIAALVLAPVGAWAADVPLSYLVEDKDLKKNAPAGTVLTFELHADAACSGPVHSQAVNVEDVDVIERLKLLKVKGATTKPPKTARLGHLLTGAPDEEVYYAKVTGTGITPVGGDCQLQVYSVGGGTDIPCVATATATETVFSGCNVLIQDGSGDTGGATNGLGNLIIGYNEDDLSPTNDQTGSHNLVIGPDHTFTSYGGLVAGKNNFLFAPHASVSGGYENEAHGSYASVSGGRLNYATGAYASVSGGYGNTASGDYASVSGGISNTASGRSASVSGGNDNEAIGSTASVSGGYGNMASGSYGASVSGGYENTAYGKSSSVSGGRDNYAIGRFSSISGGIHNTAGYYANGGSVSGGVSNTADDYGASVSGGYNNTAGGNTASVSGGQGNDASGNYSSVSGGNNRDVFGPDDWRGGSYYSTN